MEAKEYLEQARTIDQRITAKLKQLEDLEGLMVKVGTPHPSTSLRTGCHLLHEGKGACGRETPAGAGALSNIYEKIAGMREEINRDIDELVDLKREITDVIRRVPKPEYRTVLELRYLCFWKWEKISMQMGYSLHHVFKLNNSALRELGKLIDKP